MGLAILILLLIGFSGFPLCLYLWDGYKENNVKKGIYFILGFLAFIIVGNMAITILGIWLAVATPLLIPLFLMISHHSK